MKHARSLWNPFLVSFSAFPKKINFRSTVLLLCFAMLIISSSCKKWNGELTNPSTELIIYAEYVYPPGGVPKLTIDTLKSTKAIANQTAVETFFDTVSNPDRALVGIYNFRLKDELGTYQITDEIQVEEKKSGEYEPDPENHLDFISNISFDFVLVLDQSTSLGEDILTVRELAKNFIIRVSMNNANSNVGVVVFSKNIAVLPMAPPSDQTYNFIDNAQSIDETKLYQAIDSGIDLLSLSTAEGKAIIIFTDGKNNSWDDFSKYETSDFIKNRLASSNISTFCVGLENKGGIDKEVLKSLAALNGGLAEFTNDIDALGRIFEKFAGSVSSVYRLTYNRNRSTFTQPKSVRFKFKTKIL